ncbi:MAG: hypothetical protein Q9P14_11435 [candidate division KSB1 bacterium]|nr:hypothetical protein [candidate division KSB1 bacterium]
MRGRWIQRFVRMTWVLFLAWSTGCGSPSPFEQRPDEVEIHLFAFGGFAGGVVYDLTIRSDRTVTEARTRPPLSMPLDEDTYNQMLRMLTPVWNLREVYLDEHRRCSDDVEFTLDLRAGERRKTVRTWGCTLLADNAGSDVAYLKQVIEVLSQISRLVCDTTAPWLGLQVRFALNDSVFAVGEPIGIQTIVENTTGRERRIYFDSDYRIGFVLYETGVRYVTQYPFDYFPRREAPLQEVVIPDGQTRAFELTWDARYRWHASDSLRTLAPGRYRMRVGLLTTESLGPGEILEFVVQ